MAGGHVETAAVLLRYGADPNMRAASGERESPLGAAVAIGDERTARAMCWVLREAGADPAAAVGERSAVDVAAELRPDSDLAAELNRPPARYALPAGWSRHFDKQLCRPFFWHRPTGEVAWEPPLPVAG